MRLTCWARSEYLATSAERLAAPRVEIAQAAVPSNAKAQRPASSKRSAAVGRSAAAPGWTAACIAPPKRCGPDEGERFAACESARSRNAYGCDHLRITTSITGGRFVCLPSSRSSLGETTGLNATGAHLVCAPDPQRVPAHLDLVYAFAQTASGRVAHTAPLALPRSLAKHDCALRAKANEGAG